MLHDNVHQLQKSELTQEDRHKPHSRSYWQPRSEGFDVRVLLIKFSELANALLSLKGVSNYVRLSFSVISSTLE